MIDARNKCSNKPLLPPFDLLLRGNGYRVWHETVHATVVRVSGISRLPIQCLTGHHSSESETVSFALSTEEMMRIPEPHKIGSNPEKL